MCKKVLSLVKTQRKVLCLRIYMHEQFLYKHWYFWWLAYFRQYNYFLKNVIVKNGVPDQKINYIISAVNIVSCSSYCPRLSKLSLLPCTCHGLRTQMQGQFRVKNVYFYTAGLGSPSRANKEAEKILSTLLNNYGWGECSYESYHKQKATPGGKQKRLLRITNKLSRSPTEADLNKRRSLKNIGTMKLNINSKLSFNGGMTRSLKQNTNSLH